MYVALQEDNKVSILTVDPQTGRLTPQVEVPIPGGPFTMALSPGRKFLYIGCRDNPRINSYQIDQVDGGLTQNGTVPLKFNPTYIATERKGRFVLSAYYQGAHVGVHPIGKRGYSHG